MWVGGKVCVGVWVQEGNWNYPAKTMTRKDHRGHVPTEASAAPPLPAPQPGCRRMWGCPPLAPPGPPHLSISGPQHTFWGLSGNKGWTVHSISNLKSQVQGHGADPGPGTWPCRTLARRAMTRALLCALQTDCALWTVQLQRTLSQQEGHSAISAEPTALQVDAALCLCGEPRPRL